MTMAQEFKDSIEAPEVKIEGVEYLAMQPHHCRAILDQRDPHWGLPLVCGKSRTRSREGVFSSSYCAFHLRAFHNLPGQQRR